MISQRMGAADPLASSPATQLEGDQAGAELAVSKAANSGITQLTGDVTAGPGSGSQQATIAANTVTNAKLARMSGNTLKGNNTSGAANATDLTATQATAMLNPMVGDSGSGGAKGLVPAPGPGAAAAGKYLQASGVWTAPPSAGITQLTGDMTAGPGSGSQAATIAAGAVTSAKMAAGAAASNVGAVGGDLSGALPDPTIAGGAVTNAKLAQMSGNTLKGNNTSGAASAVDLTAAQATAMLNPMVGDFWFGRHTGAGSGTERRRRSRRQVSASQRGLDRTPRRRHHPAYRRHDRGAGLGITGRDTCRYRSGCRVLFIGEHHR